MQQLLSDNDAFRGKKIQPRGEWLVSGRTVWVGRLGSFRSVRKPRIDDFLKDLAMAAVFQGETGLKL
jgi:hypothetical protein